MAKGQHVARKSRRSLRWLWIVAFVVLAFGLLAGGTAFAAYRYDQGHLDVIMPGVTVAGVDVGGLTREEALAGVTTQIDEQLDRTFTVQAGGKKWESSPAELRSKPDIQGPVDQAMAVTQSFSWPTRVYHRLTENPVPGEFTVPVEINKAEVIAFVAKIGGQVGQTPVDGGLRLDDGGLQFVKSQEGRELVNGKALAKVRLALREDPGEPVKLPVRKIQPKQTGEDQLTVVVNLNQNKLYLYEGKRVIKTYPVATGAPGFPTPEGSFEIVEMRKNPTWVNPDPTGWGASMPDEIPPGPGNPLGTRAMNLNAPGIRIHGTSDIASLGTAASHGCIRMAMSDVESLFNKLGVGVPVLILR